MSVHRRGFLKSIAAGSAAYLLGCETLRPIEPADGGAHAPCAPPSPQPPPPLDYPSAAYFERISEDLDVAGIGSPVVFLDLDRVDANIAAITRAIASPLSYRIVEKSLPSLDLLAYVSRRSGSEKFLALHLPFVAELLSAFPRADVLIGKAHPTSAVRAFLQGLPTGTDLSNVAARVTFVADHSTRLGELLELARALGVTLRIAVEIDVGLRRSGLSDPAELAPLLRTFLTSTGVELAGLLGYDGHVAHTPSGSVDGVWTAWNAATEVYRSYVDVLHDPELRVLSERPDFIYHSGGSATFPMYTTGTPVNDVAAGGGVLRPGGYPNHVISELSPAIFIAAPVLRHYDAPALPFFSAAQSAAIFHGRRGLTIYGGAWPSVFTHPPDVRPAPIVTDPTDHVMVPNQSLVTAPVDAQIREGDWVFFHPRQSDALFQFEHIRLVRGGRLQQETMRPYPRRF